MRADATDRFHAELKRLVCSLAHFVGPFAGDTAALVADSADVTASLGTLCELQLVARHADGWQLTPGSKEYCAAVCDAAGETAAVTERFIATHASLAERRLVEVAAQYDNIIEALRLEKAGARAVRMCEALRTGYWWTRGMHLEGRNVVLSVLARTTDRKERAVLLCGVAGLCRLACQYTDARGYLNEALPLAEDDKTLMANIDHGLGGIACELANYGEAKRHFERALAVYRALGARRDVAFMYDKLAATAWLSGASAWKFAEQSLVYFEASGDHAARCWGRIYLGRYQEALDIARTHNFTEGIAWAQNLIGLQDRNADALRESLRLHLSVGDWWRTASVLEALAIVGVKEAPRLYASARAIRARIGTPVPAMERSAVDRLKQLPDAEPSEDPNELQRLASV